MTVLSYLLTRIDILLYFTAFIVLFLYWIHGSKKSKGKMPPGPRPLPFIGNLNLLDLKKPYESLMELSEKYGEIFTVHFGSKKMVVIAGYSAVKEALVNQADDFGERADTPLFKLTNKEKGIVFSNGESWKALRRFTLSTLRDFGMGKKTIEARIQDELISLIENFKSHNGKPFDTDLIMNCAVSNVICSIIFGERFDYDDPVFKQLIQILGANDKLSGSPKLLLFNFFPRISTFLGTHKQLMKNMDDFIEFVLKRIKHQRQEFDTNAISGFIDAYLLKQEQASGQAEKYFDDENLVYSVLDLFGAGTETISTTLRWGMLLMMKYPEIQKKLQEEIRTHIKQGQMPTADDRRKMPYTEAVIHEIQRFANIVPLNVPHTTPSDVYFRGYCIPKGTEVIPFLTSVLYDKTQWETPYEFNPNHFLDAAGKFVKRDAFMPFSAGRRVCVGESLAKMELFLFFTGLLQSFTFYPPPGVSREDISLKPGTGFVLFPLPHLVCAKLNF
ncbi:PREDICTED: cytochrome P450 2K1-like [Nanorana parkeri]|uniref:cytochrome P450 2K1-like n=1 Tax=Nanorana parkeri TaxID=125878 RepID=UPI000854495F|nr:PREDICTED: cytochrome P450 2K1-like [Nanorana parkeri]